MPSARKTIRPARSTSVPHHATRAVPIYIPGKIQPQANIFERPAGGKIAVKIINHYGDEVLKVYAV